MKKIIFILAFLLAGISAEAQKFLRYQMNDGTYNGFYTEGIESITHDYKDGVATAFVQASGKIHEIPVDAIENISVENADIDDGNAGEYRIYEFNYDEGDVKKIYVDNRTFLFASHNGDFGANDTILFSSAYNDMACLFYTDGQGRVRKIFDGKKLLYFDYDDDGSGFSMLDLETGNSYHYCFDSTLNSASRIRGIQALKGLNFFSNLLKTERGNFWGDAGLAAIGTGASEFADRMDDVGDNPELRGMFLFTDALSIAGDMLGIGLSLLGEVPTGGWSTAGLVLNAGMLMHDMHELMGHLFPDSEQMEKYKEFYRNKYAITVKTIAPENVTCNKADLRGTFMSFNGVKGDLYFTLSKLTDSGLGDRIGGSTEDVNSNSYIVKGSATNLKPGINYFYMLWYECEVNGLRFTFPADNAVDFTTPLPSATTIGEESVEERSAVVKCSYYNVNGLNNVECGVCVINTETGEIKEIPTNNADGESEINITNLTPATTYTYNAYIKINNIIVKEGERKSFKTQSLETSHINEIQTKWADPSKNNNIKKISFGIEIKGAICNHNQQYYLYYIIDDEIVLGQPIYTDENSNTFTIIKNFEFSENDIEINYSSYIAKKNIEIGICYKSDGKYVYLQTQSHILQYDEKPNLEVLNIKNVEVSKHEVYWDKPYYITFYSYTATYRFDFRVSGSFWISHVVYERALMRTADGDWPLTPEPYSIIGDALVNLSGTCFYNDRIDNGKGMEHTDCIYAETIDGKKICKKEFVWGGSLDNPTVG